MNKISTHIMALIMMVLSCQTSCQTTQTPTSSRMSTAHPKVLPTYVVQDPQMTTKMGSKLTTITGGQLQAPKPVTLWLELDTTQDKDCATYTRVYAIALNSTQLYIHQTNPMCEKQAKCRIYTLNKDTMLTPKGCLEPDMSGLGELRPIGGNRYLLISGGEGVAYAQVIQYSPSHGQKEELSIALGGGGHTISMTYKSNNQWLIETTCPLPQGCTLTTPTDVPTRRYLWRPGKQPILHEP